MKHIAIRRVELFTIRRFIETRQAKGPLTPVIMAKIGEGVNETTPARYPLLPVGFPEQLSTELDTLKSALIEAR